MNVLPETEESQVLKLLTELVLSGEGDQCENKKTVVGVWVEEMLRANKNDNNSCQFSHHDSPHIGCSLAALTCERP